jgi:hypothetical protein
MEEARRPDEGVVPVDQGTDAPAIVKAFMMEAKEDEPADQPISAEAVAAAAAAATGAADSNHVVLAQDGRDGMMDIRVEAPNGQGVGAAAAADRCGEHIISPQRP